jgi:hypothetical protein
VHIFGKKEKESRQLSKDILKEVTKIKDILEPEEEVLIVVRQGRLKPGGAMTAPNTIFATEKGLIIRNPTMLGLREV